MARRRVVFRDDTLFIVGAGASCEFGLPAGRGLASEIMSEANVPLSWVHGPETGNAALRDALERYFGREGFKERLQAVRRIASGIYMADSIDSYIDRHRADPYTVEMGKFLIA